MAALEFTCSSSSSATQVRRLCEIWEDARKFYGGRGPWLFGELSIADVLFAPVALRFVSYGVPLARGAAEFIEVVQGLASVKEWCALAEAEPERISFIDGLVPADDAPLTLG